MAVTSAPQAMPPQHLWDPKTKGANLWMALSKTVSPRGSFPISCPISCPIRLWFLSAPGVLLHPTQLRCAVFSLGWLLFPGTGFSALAVAGSMPFWRASSPCFGLPSLVQSGPYRCAGWLFCCRPAVP